MTGRRTSSPSTGLWTATIALLLFSVSVRSQSASALNEAAPSPGAAATDRPSGSVSSLRKVDAVVESSTTSKPVGERPEANLDAVTFVEDVAAGNSAPKDKRDDAHARKTPASGSGKLEEVRAIERVEEKREAAGSSLPEFGEKEDYVDAHVVDEENDREPTTPPANKKTVRPKNQSPDESTERKAEAHVGNSEDREFGAVERTKPEVGVSLANDTNVNYGSRKTPRPSKEDGILEKETEGLKSALENATNVIASGEAAERQLEKGKGPKAEVEVVKNSTLPKIQRIADRADGAGDGRKEVGSLDSAKRENNTDLPTTAIPAAKDLRRENSKIADSTVLSGSDDGAEKTEESGALPSPKGRTISFGGTNEFVTEGENKTRENDGPDDRAIGMDLTKETLQERKAPEFKPYPYAKTTVNYPSNVSDAQPALPTDREVSESTEEASALENTIGRRQEDKKVVVTEPSVVIDNSIQQFRPTYFKRSGNASRIQSGVLPSASSTTASSLGADETGASMPSTESIALANGTSARVGNGRVSNTENDVPRGKDDETRTSVGVEDASGGLDLNGNGITEVVGRTKNSTVLITDDFAFTGSPIGSTASIARATEDAQVQNSTETIVTTSDDVTLTDTDVRSATEDSTLEISPPNVTEVSTRIPTTRSADVETSTAALPRTPSSSPSSTELEDLATTITPEGSTDVAPQETPQPEESFATDGSVESTTTKVEYEFVGLTESTVSQRYIASSESSNSLAEDGDAASSTTSSFSDSSVDADSNEAVTSTVDGSTSEASTSASLFTLDFSGSEESTASMDDESDVTTIFDDLSTTERAGAPETTTEGTSVLTSGTNVPEILIDGRKNTTDTGRAVDSSSTSYPEASGAPSEIAGDSSVASTGSSESTNLSFSTEPPRIVESSEGPRVDDATSNPSTEATTAGPEVEVSSATGEATDVVTESSISGRAAVPSLVRVVFEGNWVDVCPHLTALRQSLADLLTSGLERTVLASQIIFQKNPCSDGYAPSSTELPVTSLLLYVVDQNGNFDGEMTKMLPTLYSRSPIKLQVTIHSFQLVQDSDSGNAIAVVVVSCVAFICLVLLAGLLFIMRKRQTRFNYGERCRPVSLDAYSLDSVSAYNSVRRKGAARASKRSYGNPTFEDSSAIPSHPLNFGGLATFCNEQNIIAEEFSGIPQVTARIDELPPGAEVKNRYANVVPLPETRVPLMKINSDPLTEYINASYVRGPKNATKYYIACQAPIESTVTDFWRMIWEQQSKVIIMLTDLVENGVEKCAEYIPPSEVTDCHRLFGDFQVTLKKRETKEKYAISTLHLKNLENNTFREISHIWYLWPASGVQSDAAGLIAVLLEARALQRGGPGPIVVHCSPGTGRTGTLIALDLGIRQYEITRTVDVPRVVYTIRRDRAGSVQTKEQYAFIYKALNLYATKLAGGALES